MHICAHSLTDNCSKTFLIWILLDERQCLLLVFIFIMIVHCRLSGWFFGSVFPIWENNHREQIWHFQKRSPSVITTTYGFSSSFLVIASVPSFSVHLVERETKVSRHVSRMARSTSLWTKRATYSKTSRCLLDSRTLFKYSLSHVASFES